MTLSKIVWQRFRQSMEQYRVVERTLERNPGLAALGPVLPFGTEFDLVIPGAEEQTVQVPVIRVYGVSQ
jgi:phage tail protein X